MKKQYLYLLTLFVLVAFPSSALQYELSWEGTSQNGGSYLVYGSNTLDFRENSDFLVAITTETAVTVDATFHFYRVVTKAGDLLSLPSPVLRIEYLPDEKLLKYDDKALSQTSYAQNPYVTAEVWGSVSPYFLPDNHPIKNQLDHIFTRARVTPNSKSLENAGFLNTTPGKYSNVIVTTHPTLPGYA
jgi:hypothetical protein